jgi:hypothetical protein
MRPSGLLLSALILFLVCPMHAQQPNSGAAAPPPPTRNTEAVTMLNRAFAVIAGRGTPITDITLTGTARRIAGANQETGNAILKALATGESRIDLTFPSGDRSEVYANSDKGPIGVWSGPDGKQSHLALVNILVDSAWFAPALMLSKLARSAETVASAASAEAHDGAAVEHLTVSTRFPHAAAPAASFMQRHSQMEIYLDGSSLLPDTLDFDAHPDTDARRNIPVEIRYSDYRTVDGVSVPFRVEKYMNGGLMLDFIFQRAEVNTGLSPSSFSVPEPVLDAPAKSTR